MFEQHKEKFEVQHVARAALAAALMLAVTGVVRLIQVRHHHQAEPGDGWTPLGDLPPTDPRGLGNFGNNYSAE